jgi:hypothetical protein
MLKFAKRWIIANCKFASITFTPSGSHRMAKPKTIMNIAFDMSSIGERKKLLGDIVPYKDIDIDGLDVDAPTGTINIYLPNEGSIRNARQIVEAYNDDTGGSIQVALEKVEQSNSRDTLVARVKVIKNDTVEIAKVPEVNLANGNALTVLRLLFGPDPTTSGEQDETWEPEYEGEFSVDDYWIARNKVTENAKKRFLRDPSTTQRPKSEFPDALIGKYPGEMSPWEKI